MKESKGSVHGIRDLANCDFRLSLWRGCAARTVCIIYSNLYLLQWVYVTCEGLASCVLNYIQVSTDDRRSDPQDEASAEPWVDIIPESNAATMDYSSKQRPSNLQ